MGRALVATVLCAAVALLRHELRGLRVEDVRASFRALPHWRLAACFGLTVLSYGVLTIYEMLAVRESGYPLPFSKVAMAAFTGFATSYNIGAVIGATPVRVRLYTSWGMPVSAIVRLMVVIGATFWFGIFALAGVIFVVDPFPVPAALNLGIEHVRPVGIFLLIITVGYVSLALMRREPIRWRGHEMPMPPLKTVLLQLTVSATDMIVASACLYVILPNSVPLTFWQFLGVYVLAVVAVIFTHVPGGLGVFELVIFELSGAAAKEDIVVSLLAFRVIYYLIPMGLTLILLAGHEWRLHRERMKNRLAVREQERVG